MKLVFLLIPLMFVSCVVETRPAPVYEYGTFYVPRNYPPCSPVNFGYHYGYRNSGRKHDLYLEF